LRQYPLRQTALAEHVAADGKAELVREDIVVVVDLFVVVLELVVVDRRLLLDDEEDDGRTVDEEELERVEVVVLVLVVVEVDGLVLLLTDDDDDGLLVELVDLVPPEVAEVDEDLLVVLATELVDLVVRVEEVDVGILLLLVLADEDVDLLLEVGGDRELLDVLEVELVDFGGGIDREVVEEELEVAALSHFFVLELHTPVTHSFPAVHDAPRSSSTHSLVKLQAPCPQSAEV